MRYLALFFSISLAVQCKKSPVLVEEPPISVVPYQKGKTTGFLNGDSYLGDTYCNVIGQGVNRRLVISIRTYSDNIDYFKKNEFTFSNVPYAEGQYLSEIFIGGNPGDSLRIQCNFYLLYQDGHALGPLYGQDSLFTKPSITIDSINTVSKTIHGVINAHLRKVPYLAHLDPAAPDSMHFVNCAFQVIVDEK
jgi:hypothetical protein